MIFLRVAVITLFLLCINGTKAQTMTQESFTYNNSSLNYWLYTPDVMIPNLPLLVYLHGGSGKGDDLNLLLSIDGFPKYLYDGDLGKLNAYVIIPQLSKSLTGWSNIATTLRELIMETVSKHQCDKSKISITGHSMGGTGTWAIAAKYPKLFYRIAPLSGSIKISDENVAALQESYIWTIVGSDDDIVDPQLSIDFVNALNSNTAKLTIVDEAGHFDIPQVYLSQEYKLIDWLLGKDILSSINNISNDETLHESDYYDLLGRKVTHPSHGLYIQNKHIVIFR